MVDVGGGFVLHIQRPAWLHAALAWILASNGADLALTLWGLRLGVIREANPLLAPLLATNPPLAAGLKLAAAGIAVLVLYLAYPLRPRLVAAGASLASFMLLGVLILHAWWVGLTW
jgi:hypothetical protein